MSPLYEYHDPHTGVNVELRRPVEERDTPIVLTRKSNIPQRVAIVGVAPTEEQAFDASIKAAYYKKEEKEGSRFKSGYSKKQLKEAWS
jgi:hypothetical protein